MAQYFRGRAGVSPKVVFPRRFYVSAGDLVDELVIEGSAVVRGFYYSAPANSSWRVAVVDEAGVEYTVRSGNVGAAAESGYVDLSFPVWEGSKVKVQITGGTGARAVVLVLSAAEVGV